LARKGWRAIVTTNANQQCVVFGIDLDCASDLVGASDGTSIAAGGGAAGRLFTGSAGCFLVGIGLEDERGGSALFIGDYLEPVVH
jgi:hypothetical protein